MRISHNEGDDGADDARSHTYDDDNTMRTMINFKTVIIVSVMADWHSDD